MPANGPQKFFRIRSYLNPKCLQKISDWYLEKRGILVIFETPEKDVILNNLKIFQINQQEYIKTLPECKQKELETEIKKLRVHTFKNCLSEIPTGGDTENNEQLHCYLNRGFLKSANVVSPELPLEVLAVLFFVYNEWLLNEKRSKASYFMLIPLEKQLKEQNQSKTSIEIVESVGSSCVENTEDLKSDTVIASIVARAKSLHSSLLEIKKICAKLGFYIETLLPFHCIEREF